MMNDLPETLQHPDYWKRDYLTWSVKSYETYYYEQDPGSAVKAAQTSLRGELRVLKAHYAESTNYGMRIADLKIRFTLCSLRTLGVRAELHLPTVVSKDTRSQTHRTAVPCGEFVYSHFATILSVYNETHHTHEPAATVRSAYAANYVCVPRDGRLNMGIFFSQQVTHTTAVAVATWGHIHRTAVPCGEFVYSHFVTILSVYNATHHTHGPAATMRSAYAANYVCNTARFVKISLTQYVLHADPTPFTFMTADPQEDRATTCYREEGREEGCAATCNCKEGHAKEDRAAICRLQDPINSTVKPVTVKKATLKKTAQLSAVLKTPRKFTVKACRSSSRRIADIPSFDDGEEADSVTGIAPVDYPVIINAVRLQLGPLPRKESRWIVNDVDVSEKWHFFKEESLKLSNGGGLFVESHVQQILYAFNFFILLNYHASLITIGNLKIAAVERHTLFKRTSCGNRRPACFTGNRCWKSSLSFLLPAKLEVVIALPPVVLPPMEIVINYAVRLRLCGYAGRLRLCSEAMVAE
ncbi:hypothetical protein BC936DRAFT_147526 [Jimgerdemannia flammicorona]|uniref:Uncharacterized protein n=1 Tax=Jimgerdemannia flammicorona TaxID=994334 RepID=A0A433D584_9FUNG|nr:hypothetical protein BC936DRAFT_147526 [Jimgerdemannia flammicorona]